MSDDQFQLLNKRFDKQDETILKLYQHVERRFDQVDKRYAELKTDISRVYQLVDEDLKRREIDEQERLVMNHQLDRHEGWIKQASPCLGIGYDH